MTRAERVATARAVMRTAADPDRFPADLRDAAALMRDTAEEYVRTGTADAYADLYAAAAVFYGAVHARGGTV